VRTTHTTASSQADTDPRTLARHVRSALSTPMSARAPRQASATHKHDLSALFSDVSAAESPPREDDDEADGGDGSEFVARPIARWPGIERDGEDEDAQGDGDEEDDAALSESGDDRSASEEEEEEEQSGSETYVTDFGGPVVRDDDWEGVRVSRANIVPVYDSDDSDENDVDDDEDGQDADEDVDQAMRLGTRALECERGHVHGNQMFGIYAADDNYDKPTDWGDLVDTELDDFDELVLDAASGEEDDDSHGGSYYSSDGGNAADDGERDRGCKDQRDIEELEDDELRAGRYDMPDSDDDNDFDLEDALYASGLHSSLGGTSILASPGRVPTIERSQDDAGDVDGEGDEEFGAFDSHESLEVPAAARVHTPELEDISLDVTAPARNRATAMLTPPVLPQTPHTPHAPHAHQSEQERASVGSRFEMDAPLALPETPISAEPQTHSAEAARASRIRNAPTAPPLEFPMSPDVSPVRAPISNAPPSHVPPPQSLSGSQPQVPVEQQHDTIHRMATDDVDVAVFTAAIAKSVPPSQELSADSSTQAVSEDPAMASMSPRLVSIARSAHDQQDRMIELEGVPQPRHKAPDPVEPRVPLPADLSWNDHSPAAVSIPVAYRLPSPAPPATPRPPSHEEPPSLAAQAPVHTRSVEHWTLRARLEAVTSELGSTQVLTAFNVAEAAEACNSRDKNGSSSDARLQGEVAQLRRTLDLLARLVLERAYELRDSEAAQSLSE
jgi:hypothetical protein